ncbi:MAG: adenosine kinase [Gemmatimonadota bacterium]
MPAAYDVYGIGHAVVDTQYAVDARTIARLGIEKGVMTLIDEAGRARLLAGLPMAPARSASGGSAANTLIALTRFGGRAYFACQVGDDDWGRFYRRDLDRAGVASSPAAHRSGATGQCLVLVTPDADRTMNTFLGVSAGMGPDQIEPEVVGASRWVYLEGYLLSSGAGVAACRLAQAEAHRQGHAVALTLSDPTIVGLFGQAFEQVLDGGVDLLLCNEDEARAITGQEDRGRAADALGSRVGAACITCGADGALTIDAGGIVSVPGFRTAAVDTTGAGDAFAGGVLYGLTHGHPLASAATLGCYAAALVVSCFGPRLEETIGQRVEAILNRTAPLPTRGR